MIVGSIARRYARALLQIGIAQQSFEKFEQEIERFAGTYAGSKDLSTVLENPVFPLAQRKGILDEITRRLALSPIVRNFLFLLLDRARIGAIGDIAREYRTLVDQQAGRLRARVTAAQPLDPGIQMKVKSALERRSGKKVILETGLDPSLLGGVVTQIGDVVYDGSIRTQLEGLRQQLLAE